MRNAEYWIEKLQLLPHPEGGYFREMYRCADIIPGKALPHRFAGARSFSTAIYFLLKSGQISVLHRIHSDELWHFYQGSAVTLQLIHPTGERQTLHLGSDPEKSESLQIVVPAGCWFGACVDALQSYALVGCTVAPGFDFQDFYLGKREDLLKQYPQHLQVIEQFTIVSS
jgi:uncharacterized protein